MTQFRKFAFAGSNCTYTTDNGKRAVLSIDVLLKVMNNIPKPPRIYSMPISILRKPMLPSNTIIISNDIADALEELSKD